MQSSTLAPATSRALGQPAVRRRGRVAAGLLGSLRQWWRFKLIAGGIILLGLILVGVFGPLATPFDPNRQALNDSLVSPQWFGGPHTLGTDNLGRDILSRLISGARISLLVA